MWQGKVAAQAESEESEEETEVKPLWREHENGGLAFRPVAGNAIFWVNLHANGTGDERTNHAGLPLGKGRKTAMNIWPRQYYPYE
jgi:prolyl 4-hydroxylase